MRRSLLLLALAATVVTAVTASAALLAVEGGTLEVFTFPVDLGPIAANVDIDPDTLNPDSEGNFVMAYIELPEPWDVADIDVSTVRLAAEGEAATVWAESHPTEVGDHDGDGIPDAMVKFDRQRVLALFEGRFGLVTLVVTGQVATRAFEGTYTVNILDPPAATPIPSGTPSLTPTATPSVGETPVPEATTPATPEARTSSGSDEGT